MVGNTWHKAVTIILCILSAYLLLSRLPELRNQNQKMSRHVQDKEEEVETAMQKIDSLRQDLGRVEKLRRELEGRSEEAEQEANKERKLRERSEEYSRNMEGELERIATRHEGRSPSINSQDSSGEVSRPSSTQQSLQSPADHASHLQSYEEKTNIVGTTCVIPDLTNYEQFYSYFDKPKAACNHKEKVGGKRSHFKDGDKWVCFDKGFKPDNCVVYSFGINNEWSFDDVMDQKKHCQVFSFDPTMGAKDHQRSERISFFNLGLSDYKGSTMMKDKNCSMDRYSGIVEKLGHRSTVIDYLKMDIEGSELEFFKDVLDNNLELLDNIKQIGLEVHPRTPNKEISQRFRDFWEIFHRLECLGWRLLNAEMNRVHLNHFRLGGTTRSKCYEVVWIKI